MTEPIAGTLDDRTIARLESDLNGWLTTVRADGQPQSSLVWFYWDDGVVWVRSKAGAPKVRNLAEPAGVAFNLNSNEVGGDVVTLQGQAQIVDDPPEDVVAAYLAKYNERITEHLDMTHEDMLAEYPVTIRIDVTRARAW